MKLDKKKALAVSTLGVGKGRIIFNQERLDEIQSAITKQDIRDLFASGAIAIRNIQGKRKVEGRSRRRAGSIKKTIKPGKRRYMTLTRKLRAYVKELLDQEKITKDQYIKIRQQIRAHTFKSKANLKEHLGHMEVK